MRWVVEAADRPEAAGPEDADAEDAEAAGSDPRTATTATKGDTRTGGIPAAGHISASQEELED